MIPLTQYLPIEISVKENIKEAKGKLLIVPMFSEQLKDVAEWLKQEVDEKLYNLVLEEFKAKREETWIANLPTTWNIDRLILVGLGEKDKATINILRNTFGVFSRRFLKTLKEATIVIKIDLIKEKFQENTWKAIYEGIQLGIYEFKHYKKKTENNGNKRNVKEMIIIEEKGKLENLTEEKKELDTILEAVYISRDLANHPANVVNPITFANFVENIFKGIENVKVEIYDKQAIEKMQMGGIIGVSSGSEIEPRFVVVEYKGKGGEETDVVLIGKGVTFDSGGISLKPSENMETMKMDMSGAADVIAITWAISRLKWNVNIVALAPLVENMPSGKAQKPGDIINIQNKKFVEVINTDAEGRLILADAMVYAEKYKPKLVIDVATLTGACMVALGLEAAGLFVNKDAEKYVEELTRIGEEVGERVWQLPLWEEYDEYLKSDMADIKNVGGRWGGAITAAAFLKSFSSYPWIHLDIAPVAWVEKERGFSPKGATAFSVRLLSKFIKEFFLKEK